MWSGVFERHPDLRYVVAENGAWWAPDILAKMDEKYLGGHNTAKMGGVFTEHLSMKPSEYFDRNCFVGASVIGRSDVEMRHAIGVGNIMWGSDFPHPEGAWPRTREFMRASFHGIPEEDVRDILGGTAARVYNFDIEKLAPLVERIGPTPGDL
jgi:predicted TIM-barrel fold metal-dependent hydrolase